MAGNNDELKRLRDSEEKYRKMIEMANDAIFTIDTSDATIQEVNRKAEEFLGRSREELVGKKVWSLHPDDEHELARQLFDEVIQYGKGLCSQLHLLHADGSTITVDISASIIEYGDKRVIQRICRDVTTRQVLEERNSYLKDYYEHILNMMPVGLGVQRDVSGEPSVEFENKKLKEMFAECEAKNLPWRWYESSEYIRDHTKATLNESGVYAEEKTMPNGRTYLFTTSYFRSRGGSWRELQVIQDITQRRRLEDQLREAKEGLEVKVEERTRELREKQSQLAQAEKMASLGNLVAGIAHEINTPLGALRSNNDLFLRSISKLRNLIEDADKSSVLAQNEQVQKLFENIQRLSEVSEDAARRIVEIVTSLRSFARLDRAEMDTFDIHEGIESTLTLVHHQLKNRVEVHKEFGELPKIECFPNQLNQVFMNILVNASQAIDEKGEIHIRTRQEDDGVVIEFEDTGRGMSEEVKQKVFDPGFTTKGTGVGTGLGLSIVHQIVQQHRGRITVESEAGKGSVFRLWLPIRQP